MGRQGTSASLLPFRGGVSILGTSLGGGLLLLLLGCQGHAFGDVFEFVGGAGARPFVMPHTMVRSDATSKMLGVRLGGDKELLGLCGRRRQDNVLSRGAMDEAVEGDTPWYAPHNQRRRNGEVGPGHQDQVKELERHGRLYGCRCKTKG